MNGNEISLWITGLKMWPLIVVLVPNLLFRKYGKAASRKRMASLYHAIAVFLITTTAGFIVARELTDKYLLAGTALVIVLMVVFRKRVFPYRLTCAGCSKRLDSKTIYFLDDNLCPACLAATAATDDAAGESPSSGNAEPDDSGE
jgi:8-oxo-dGTP diphosphatase